jgi:hypothetical protein
MNDASVTMAAAEMKARMCAPVWGSGPVPIDITRRPAKKTLRLGKAFVKDVKCLILLDLSVFAPC